MNELILSALDQALPLLVKFLEEQVASGKARAEIHLAAQLVHDWFCGYRCGNRDALIKTADAVADAAEIAKFGK